MNLLLQLLANGIVNGALYMMLAVGFGLVYRTTYIFHIAYGGIYIASAYFFYTFAVIVHLPIIASVLLTVGCSAVLGYLMEHLLYRPFYRKRANSGVMLIASLGMFIIIENSIALLFGNEIKTISRGLSESWRIGPILIMDIQVVEFAVGLVTVVLFWFAVRRLWIFKAIWAMGDEPDLIPVLGLPLFRLRDVVFMLSSVFVAVPACLISLDVGVDPHMGISYMLIAAVSVLAGGIRRLNGWITGAMLLAILQSLAVWKFSSRWIDLVTFCLLVFMLLLRPHGLISTHSRAEERT